MSKAFFKTEIFLTLLQPRKGQADNNLSHRTNYIDSIQNAQQITHLLSKIDSNYNEFKVNDKLRFTDKKCQNLSDSLKIQPWTKADFDNNGLTDILVIGSWDDYSVVCILDKNGTYEIKPITRRSFQECTFPIVENNIIKYYFESEPERGMWDKPRKLEQITLTYKFGDFIEENTKPKNTNIEKIEYSTTGCYGICPVFDLTINSDLTAKWHAKRYNKINHLELGGIYSSIITENKYKDIINLLNYIEFENLKNEYAVNWTDDQSSTLKITFNNGKVKSIHDYGLIGTYGLDRVYQLLFELRENQKWTR